MLQLIALWKRLRPPVPDWQWDDYFAPGEHLIWQGAPARRFTVRLSHIGLTLFGLPFLAGGIGMTGGGLFMAIAPDSLNEHFGGLGLAVFGLPFLGAGLALVFGTWCFAAAGHAFVRYAVTDRCAYVATMWWSQQVTCYPVPPHARINIRNGRHDTVSFNYADGKDGGGDTQHVKVEFHDVSEGPRIYALLRDIQAPAKD